MEFQNFRFAISGDALKAIKNGEFSLSRELWAELWQGGRPVSYYQLEIE